MRWRRLVHHGATRAFGPGWSLPPVRWIADTGVGVGGVPTAATLPRLPAAGVTHVVNCRARLQTLITQDLALERALFGPDRVLHAPIRDTGRLQPPGPWSAAVLAAARILDQDPHAGILVHCHHGRHRSVMIAYAVLRVRGHAAADALALIRRCHPDADPLPRYTESVERWLAGTARGR